VQLHGFARASLLPRLSPHSLLFKLTLPFLLLLSPYSLSLSLFLPFLSFFSSVGQKKSLLSVQLEAAALINLSLIALPLSLSNLDFSPLILSLSLSAISLSLSFFLLWFAAMPPFPIMQEVLNQSLPALSLSLHISFSLR
jgi:hypothetical protein